MHLGVAALLDFYHAHRGDEMLVWISQDTHIKSPHQSKSKDVGVLIFLLIFPDFSS